MSEKANTKGFKNLLYDFAESVSCNSEAANEYLLEEGFNVDSLLNKSLKHIKKTELILKAEKDKSNVKSLIQEALTEIKKIIEKNQGLSTVELVNILSERAPSFHYRSLEKWDDNQIIEVLEDIDLIKFIEEIDEANNL